MKNRKITTKLSTTILIVLFIILVAGVFASGLEFRNVYNKRYKGDLYWNYTNVLQQPFKHLKIKGGNITRIIFEQSKKPSVRILSSWGGYKKDSLTASVKNDTLYFNFKKHYANMDEKNYMQGTVLVRLFAPQLLSVDGVNTNFELEKLKQKNFNVNLSGKSKLEVESYDHDFDTVNVTQTDSTNVEFEMSPDLKGSSTMHFKHVTANIKGYSLLDIGRSYIDDLKLNIADSSAIILSGKSLKELHK